jgi:hypothetical protein
MFMLMLMLLRADMEDLLAREQVLHIMLTAILITCLLLLIAMLSHLGILLRHHRPTLITTVAMIIILVTTVVVGLAIPFHLQPIRPSTIDLTMDLLHRLDFMTRLQRRREHLLLEILELPLLQHAHRLMSFELEDVLAKRVGMCSPVRFVVLEPYELAPISHFFYAIDASSSTASALP